MGQNVELITASTVSCTTGVKTSGEEGASERTCKSLHGVSNTMNMTWYSLASDSTPHISQCIATAALMAGAMQVGPLKFTLARAVAYACNAATAPSQRG
jgi:hypothetical protein